MANTPKGFDNYRVQRLLGVLPKSKGKATLENIPSKFDRSRYSCERYKFLLDAPFDVCNRCCNIMKKYPSHKYAKETGRKPILASTAAESRIRSQQWIKHGCNGFDMASPVSNPMSFWTEQDVLLYIKLNKLPIASVYGEVVYDNDDDNLDEQMELSDLDPSQFGLFDLENKPLKVTGYRRTGCIFCGFGCHMKGDDRFVRLKTTHPKTYEYLFKPVEEGGLGYKEVIDWINEHGNLNIKY